MSQTDNGAPRRIRNGLVAAAVLAIGLSAAPAAAQDSTQVEKDTVAYAPAPAEQAAPGQVNVELLSVASSGISGTG